MGQKIEFDFEVLYQQYPRREGKYRGMVRLKSSIKTQEQYDQFKLAMDNYIKLCKTEDRISRGYVKLWSTFVNNWVDYIEDLSTPTATRNQLERIAKGEL